MKAASLNPKVFTLSNGLTLIVEEDSSLPFATVQFCYATGSIHEETHLGSGLSHLLERILAKEIKQKISNSITQELPNHSGNIHAFTKHHQTVYDINLPSAKITSIIEILADGMMNAVLSVEDYTAAQQVIRKEIAMSAHHPDIVSWNLLNRTAFQISPLREPIIGHLDIFNKLTHDDVIAYYKKRYVPNNLCLIIIGDVIAEKIKNQTSKFFKKYPSKSIKPIFIPEEPLQLSKRIQRQTFSHKLSYLNLAWRGPSLTSSEAPVLEMIAALLKQEMCEKKDLFQQFFSRFNAFHHKEGYFLIKAIIDPEKRNVAETEILHQIELLKTHEKTGKEFEKSKNFLISSYRRVIDVVENRAFHYGSGWVGTGDPFFIQKYFDAISQVTPEEVKRVASKYLVDSRLNLVSLDPRPLS